jgi:hypothetical protein
MSPDYFKCERCEECFNTEWCGRCNFDDGCDGFAVCEDCVDDSNVFVQYSRRKSYYHFRVCDECIKNYDPSKIDKQFEEEYLDDYGLTRVTLAKKMEKVKHLKFGRDAMIKRIEKELEEVTESSERCKKRSEELLTKLADLQLK